MHILAGQIARDIKQQGLSAVYEPELSRVWPEGGIKRERQIESFAKKHGWRLRHYKDGFVAVFDKDGTTPLLAKKLMLFSNVYDDKQRAEAYATLDFPGTYYLAYRDLPAIIAEHVVGKDALDFGCGATPTPIIP